MAYIPIREPGTGWLLMYYDPDAQKVEIQRRGKKTVIDLKALTARVKGAVTEGTAVKERATGPPA